jgi:hypothetical protein
MVVSFWVLLVVLGASIILGGIVDKIIDFMLYEYPYREKK